jgi:hypothetical protein
MHLDSIVLNNNQVQDLEILTLKLWLYQFILMETLGALVYLEKSTTTMWKPKPLHKSMGVVMILELEEMDQYGAQVVTLGIMVHLFTDTILAFLILLLHLGKRFLDWHSKLMPITLNLQQSPMTMHSICSLLNQND